MKKMLRLLFVIVLSLLPTLSHGQNYQVFTSDNSGLPYNLVYSIDFDRNGNIWFGGQRDAATGVAKVSRLSRNLQTWKAFEQTEIGTDGLEDRVFYVAVDDRNTAWFCTHYGVSYLRADGTAGVVEFTRDKYTRTVETDSKGNIYISQREDNRADSRIYVSTDHGATWTPWGLPDLGFTLGPSNARPEIYDLREDSKGQLWICTWYGVTYRKHDGTWKCFSELEGEYTIAMTIDPDDHVWVPNYDTKDLYEILPDETIIKHDSTTIEPLKYAINDLEADCNGHIWCALNGGGLLEILPDRTFKQYTVESTNGGIPENNLTHMEIRDNVIWASGAANGIVRISGLIQVGDNQVYTAANSGLPYNLVYSIDFDRNGNIWFGGQRDAATGVAKVSRLSRDLQTWKAYEQTEIGTDALEDRVFYIAVDDQNTAWFCTHYGVSYLRADGTAGVVEFTRDKYTRTVETDSKGNIYISQREDNRADSRIYVSTDHGATWTAWGLPDLGFALGPSAARPEIYDLREDSKGQLWLCTWYGVTYRKHDGTWKSLSAIEGEYTIAMTIDPDDHVWVPNYDTKDLYEILPDETIIKHDSTTIEPLKYAINDLEADCNGHIWCALNGGGLLEILPDRSFRQYTMATSIVQIPEDNLTHLEIKNNVIWASGANNGIARIASLINTGPTAVFDNFPKDQPPSEFALLANYPNPFNPTTNIRFDLDRNAHIELAIFNLRGELIKVITSGYLNAGSYQFSWDGKDQNDQSVASGVYLYRLKAGNESVTQKMTYLR